MLLYIRGHTAVVHPGSDGIMAANQEQERLAAAASLLAAARSATLATIYAGVPYASLVTPAVDEDGAVVLLLSDLAAHTRHLKDNPACALLVMGSAQSENPQTIPRLNLNGVARPVPAGVVRALYLAAHPYAAQYIDFSDFSFWKITVSTSQYIGGFGNAGPLDVAALQHEISVLLRRGYG
jgi:heme iron utilization protein